MISGLTMVQGGSPKPQAAFGVGGQGCFLPGLMDALAKVDGKAAPMTGQPGQAPDLKAMHALPTVNDNAEPIDLESPANALGLPEQETSVEMSGGFEQPSLIEAMTPGVPVETSPDQVKPASPDVDVKPVLDGGVPGQAMVGAAPSPAGENMDTAPASPGTAQQTAPVVGPIPGAPPVTGTLPVGGSPDQPTVQSGSGQERLEAVVTHPETTGSDGKSGAPQVSARNAPVDAPVIRLPSVAVTRSPALTAFTTVTPDEAAAPAETAAAASQPVPAEAPGTGMATPRTGQTGHVPDAGTKEPSDTPVAPRAATVTGVNPVFARTVPVDAAGIPGNAEIPDLTRLGTEIVDKALMAVEKARWSPDGKATLEIRLNPPHLGQLKVRVVYTSGEVDIRFFTVEQTVRDAVQQALPTLRESLGRQDIQLSGGDVHFGAGSHQEEGGAWGRREMPVGFAGVTPPAWPGGPAEAGGPVVTGLDLLA